MSKEKNKTYISEKVGKWLEKNRSLVLRQTPFWAQSIVGVLIGIGTLSVIAGLIFRIDEVITVTGQLEAISGSVDIKAPVGGKIDKVYFKDGQIIEKGELLATFDTREAEVNQKTIVELIELEEKEIKNTQRVLNSRKIVATAKLETAKQLATELKKLVAVGGIQKFQYLKKQDEIFELEEALKSLEIELDSETINSEKRLKRLRNELNKASVKLQYQNVVATTSGIIFEPQIGKSSVIGAGQTSYNCAAGRT